MKKIFNKIFKKGGSTDGVSSRITNETLDHHREKILSSGRKFKYPIQYSRHKLVFNTIFISFGVVVILSVICWWQLYPAQNASDFFYRITKVLPLPVASVDNKQVRYSDYLMRYLSSIHYLQQQEQVDLKTEDGKRQMSYIKNQSMDAAIVDTYASKLATDLKLSVSDVEVEAFLNSQEQSEGVTLSDKTYESVISDYYNWDMDEYRYVIKLELLRQKVAYQVDQQAVNIANKTDKLLVTDPNINLKNLVETLKSQGLGNVNYGNSGLVSKSNQDGGLAIEAAKMIKGQTSSVIKPTTGDGYYFIKLIDVNDSQVNYDYIHISLTQFDTDLKDVINTGKVQKYISL